jgi:hypothetical protein
VTREEFNERLHSGGGFRIHIRLIGTEEGGRRTPISGASDYRVNWSIESRDPDQQMGGPTLIDADLLRPGEEGIASLIPFAPEAWSSVAVGTSLTGFEGARPVAFAIVTQVIQPVGLALRLRLHNGEAFCISLDSEAAILLRDALYDDASNQSSSEACALIDVLLNDQSDPPERVISQEVAADLVRGIDRVSDIYGSRPALVELRARLRPAS